MKKNDLGLERAKILSVDLDLDFEEGREVLCFGLGLYFKEGKESLIWKRLSLFEE